MNTDRVQLYELRSLRPVFYASLGVDLMKEALLSHSPAPNLGVVDGHNQPEFPASIQHQLLLEEA